MSLITPDFGLIFWQTVTLLLVLAILKRYAWKPILQAIHARESYVSGALRAAEEANQAVAQVKERQVALMEEAQAERENLLAMAAKTRQVMLAEAKQEAEEIEARLIARAHTTIAQEKKAAIRELTQQTALLSIQIAESLLKRELQHDDEQQTLVAKQLKGRLAL